MKSNKLSCLAGCSTLIMSSQPLRMKNTSLHCDKVPLQTAPLSHEQQQTRGYQLVPVILQNTACCVNDYPYDWVNSQVIIMGPSKTNFCFVVLFILRKYDLKTKTKKHHTNKFLKRKKWKSCSSRLMPTPLVYIIQCWIPDWMWTVHRITLCPRPPVASTASSLP